VPVLLVPTFFYDTEKFYTLPDHVYRYDGSHTTFLRHRASEGSIFLLIWGLFSAVSVSSAVLLISSFCGVDLPVIPFSWWPLATRLQKSSLGFRSLYAYIDDHEQISHHFGLLHGYLFHSFDIADTITEGVNDLDVLGVRDVVSGIAETLDIIMKILIMLLLDGLEGLGSRRMLIGALEVPDEHDTQLVSGVNGSLEYIDEPQSGRSGQCRMQEVGIYSIISTDSFYDDLINLNKFFGIAGAIILINVTCLELGRPPDLPEWPR
jgi:hypothetical protein